jgi:hypothetical protein
MHPSQKRQKRVNKKPFTISLTSGGGFCQTYGKDYGENYNNRYKQRVTIHHSELTGVKTVQLSIGELIPQAFAVHRLVSFWGVTRAGLLSCFSWSPVISWEVESCQGRVLRSQKVILHGEAGSGMHFHLREAVLTLLWWILGEFTVTLTAVGVVQKITIKGPLQWGFNGWTFYIYIFFFYLDNVYFFN